jgi:hypothetical protein
MVIADDRKKSSRTLHLQANIDGIITIAEDIGVLAPKAWKLLVGSSFLIQSRTRNWCRHNVCGAKRNRVYSPSLPNLESLLKVG